MENLVGGAPADVKMAVTGKCDTHPGDRYDKIVHDFFFLDVDELKAVLTEAAVAYNHKLGIGRYRHIQRQVTQGLGFAGRAQGPSVGQFDRCREMDGFAGEEEGGKENEDVDAGHGLLVVKGWWWWMVDDMRYSWSSLEG